MLSRVAWISVPRETLSVVGVLDILLVAGPLRAVCVQALEEQALKQRLSAVTDPVHASRPAVNAHTHVHTLRRA